MNGLPCKRLVCRAEKNSLSVVDQSIATSQNTEW